MYARILIALLLVPALSGCLVDMLATTATEGVLHKKSMESSMKALEYAKRTTGQLSVDQAIAAYQAEHGEYPASLEALVPDYFPSVPTKPDGSSYAYDSSTGSLDGVVVAAAPMPAVNPDAVALQQIQEAINKYGTQTGYYPPSLQALVPLYIAQLPKASNGQDFLFNPTTGQLTSPVQGAAAPGFPPPAQAAGGSRGGGAVGGGGPMGEALTGIAIQNELNSMSNAGSSAAGSRARSGVRDVGANQNDRTDKAMDDLGL